MSWQDFPMITCPLCGKESQIDDYCDFKAGDSFYCLRCGKQLYLWAIDATLSGDIQTGPPR